MIIIPNPKANCVLGQELEATIHRRPIRSSDGLVNYRLVKRHRTVSSNDNEIAILVQLQSSCPFELKLNGPCVHSGGQLEIHFEMPLITVIQEVHTGKSVQIPDFFEGLDIPVPFCRIISQKVIHRPWQSSLTGRGRS